MGLAAGLANAGAPGFSTGEPTRSPTSEVNVLPGEATLSAYDPSIQERLKGGMQDAMEAVGTPRGTAQDYSGRFAGAAYYAPVLGSIIAGDHAMRAADAGNYGSAALQGLGALPIGPGKAVGLLSKLVEKAPAALKYGAAGVALGGAGYEGAQVASDLQSGDLTDETLGRAALGTGMAFAAGMPFAPKGALGIFGGRMSQTADLTKLALAQRLQKAGADKAHIFDTTGFFTGAEGKWRNEIPDQAATLKVPHRIGSMGTLSDVLDHPELFAAYPELANVNVNGRSNRVPYDAQFNTAENRIDITPGAMRSTATLLHEVQHAIQNREGFTFGNSDEWVPTQTVAGYMATAARPAIDAAVADKQAAATELFGRLKAAREAGGNYPTADSFVAAHPELQPLADRVWQPTPQAKTPYDVYHQTAGEVEARNVAGRSQMQNPSRPWETEDVPANRQYLAENIGRYAYDLKRGTPLSDLLARYGR